MNLKLKLNFKLFWRNWCQPILVVVVVLCSFRSAVADWNDVPTGSMKPSILIGDRIFVNKLAYDLKVPFTTIHLAKWGDPERGDLVVLFSPEDGTRLVKRVVGLPGDVVAMRDNLLILNDEPVSYSRLDADSVEQIEAAERGKYDFALEALGTHDHPVMSTPRIVARRSFEPVVLGPEEYWVMGDNRDQSKDSRYWGVASRDSIVGRVSRVVFSVNSERYYLPRLDRFFRRIP